MPVNEHCDICFSILTVATLCLLTRYFASTPFCQLVAKSLVGTHMYVLLRTDHREVCDGRCAGVGNMPSLWVGTNGGHAYVYTLIVPGSDKRSTDTVSCTLAKEIKLRHRAPIIAFAVTDNRNHILPDPLEVSNERAKAPEMDSHSVLICSEEQLKVCCLLTSQPAVL